MVANFIAMLFCFNWTSHAKKYFCLSNQKPRPLRCLLSVWSLNIVPVYIDRISRVYSDFAIHCSVVFPSVSIKALASSWCSYCLQHERPCCIDCTNSNERSNTTQKRMFLNARGTLQLYFIDLLAEQFWKYILYRTKS